MADIKRLNYFTSQFLIDQDFKDEQAYHVSMRRRHNRALHTWGVVEGLTVTRTGDRQVTVAAGTALDRDGREIVLTDDTVVDLSRAGPDDMVYVTMTYQETWDETDRYKKEGIDDYLRITEQPKLDPQTTVPPSDGTVIVLARVELESGSVITIDVSSSVRRRAGSVIPPETDLTVRSIALSPPSGGWPRFSSGAGGRVDLAGSLTVSGELRGSGLASFASLGIGVATPLVPLDVRGWGRVAGLQISDANGQPYPGNFIAMVQGLDGTTRWLQISGIVEGNVRRVSLFGDRVHVSGNLGVGTATPGKKLDIVGGGLRIGNGHLSTNAGNGSLVFNAGPADATNMAGIWFRRATVLGEESAFAELMRITETGNVGIGTTGPQQRLSVRGVDATANGFAAAIGLSNGAAGGGNWFLRAGATGTATPAGGFSIADDTAYRLVIENSGNVGIGLTDPRTQLHVLGRIATGIDFQSGGALTFYPPDGAAWFHIDNGPAGGRPTGRLRISYGGNPGDNEVVSILQNNLVGIGTPTPAYRLDVADRIRLRAGPQGSAGMWLYQGATPTDRVFIGMLNDDVYGFYGAVGWGLQWNRATGNLWVSGAISAGGGKGGYVMDQFVNAVGEILEQGDVVVIGSNQASQFYGMNGGIPVPEVDVTDRDYDTRICGIVCEAYEAPPAPPESGAPPEQSDMQLQLSEEEPKKSKRTKGAKSRAAELKSPPLAQRAGDLDRTKVAPGQNGWMVTLGAYTHCKVDADVAPIAVGDLLTTSTTKGHAQKVIDPAKATGAIVGKALGPLRKGKGKIPVLVMLQ